MLAMAEAGTGPSRKLGRPLPWGSPNRLPMEDFDRLPLEENHRLAVGYFNAAVFFPAHEAWETCWKQSKGTADEEFFKGLSQLGAGYVHYQRGNHHGAKTLLRRGAGRVAAYGESHRGVSAARLAETALAQADAIETAQRAGRGLPEITFPRI